MNIGMVGWSKVMGVAGVMAVSLGVALPAAAQEPPGPEPAGTEVAPPQPVIQQAPSTRPASPEDLPPSFATLDRQDTASRFGVQAGFMKLDNTSIDDAFFTRFDLYGQYVIPGHNIGIYGQLPIVRSFVSVPGLESATAVGNLEMGAYGMPFGNNDLILKAGLMLSTSSDGLNEVIANVNTAFERLTDLPVSVATNTTLLRLSASTLQQRDNVFFRGDAGLDLIIDQDGNSDQDIYGRLNLAAGVRLPAVDLSGELVTYGVLDGPEAPSVTDRFFHTGALALRSRGENQVHAAFVLPLDDAIRGEVWIFSLGYQRAM